MKVLVTGSSGTGKSTAIQALAELGYTAIDGDVEPALVRLEIKETGEPAEFPKGFVDWSYYSWNLQEPALTEVLARDETVILGGIFGNQPDYYSLFDKLVVLTLNPDEHLHRMRTRPKRESSDSEENIQDRTNKYQVLLKRFLDSGAIPIDASGTPKQTAQAIIEIIREN